MSLTVDIITPEKLVLSAEADFVAAPAVDGEVGILPGHAPLLTRLGLGELRLKTGTETKSFALTGGFLEVQKGNKVEVFAETAEMAEDINVERAQLALERAKTQITQSRDLTAAELAQMEAALSRAILRLKLGAVVRRHAPSRGE